MVWLLIALLAAPVTPRGHPRKSSGAVEQLSDAELASRIEAYLGSIDTPISGERWHALGPRAALVLEPLIADSAALPTRRAHALEGLSFAAPEKAAPMLGKLARDEDQPKVLRIVALQAAGRLLPRAQLLAEVRPVLENAKDASMRGVAGEVLAQHGHCKLVREWVANDDVEAFRRALAWCGQE